MAYCVPYRFVRLTTVFTDIEGFELINHYYGVEINSELLVKRKGDDTLYHASVAELSDYSTDDNWFTIFGCRKLQPANNIDNSWCLLVEEAFEQFGEKKTF